MSQPPGLNNNNKSWFRKLFARRPPPLHRALNGNDDGEVDVLLIEELTTKRHVRQKDAMKRNALHIACLNQPTLPRVQLLVHVYPAATGEQDRVGRLPLHAACAHQASKAVVKFLVEQDPDSIFDTTDRGSTALFCALENKASYDVVQYLVERDPQALYLSQYKLGKTPVHAAAARGQSLQVVQLLLQKRPHASEEKDAWGRTPLACACADANVRTPVLDFLTDSVSIETTDRGGQLPLHIACANGVHVSNIELLVDEYPNSICRPDHNGRLPMHAACTNPRVEIRTLEFLQRAYPDALKTFDKLGSLPLHLAIQRKLPTDALLWLIEKCPGAVRSRESATKLYPLHLACRGGADLALLETLIDIYPAAMDACDNKGNTLFHVACMYRLLNLELTELLLDKCKPDTICRANQDGSLPLHLACQHRAPWSVLELLIDHYPEALVTKDKRGNVPLHKAFSTITEMPVLVRLAQANHHALYKRNNKKKTPEDCCASELLQKRFRRARYWYNMRVAYCPICIRSKGLK